MSEPKEPGGGDPSIALSDEQSIPVNGEAVLSTAARALELLGIPAGAALFVTLVEPDRMAELKQQALGVYRATDVLSFPMDDPDDPSPGPLVLGDVIVCPAVASSQARTLGRSLDEELRELLVHGLLHIAGRDHQDPATELAMANEQRALMAALEPEPIR